MEPSTQSPADLPALLAIESTCDETAAAVIDASFRVLGEAVATQEELHRRFDGVVPEIAARAHLERIVPTIESAMRAASMTPERLVAIAVATEPGLPGSLLVGLSAAKGLALAWGKPLVAVNHLQAHVYACGLGRAESIFPCLGFIVSGGHTHLYDCQSPRRWQLVGGTIDDAAGEAFDKVGVLLGIPFPGGPHVAKLAEQGDPKAFRLPRPLLDDPQRLDFSFSGLKTAVRYQLYGVAAGDVDPRRLSEAHRHDMAASFQEAVLDCLIGKARAALRRTGHRRLCLGGGVVANRRFRQRLVDELGGDRFEIIMAPPAWCTDNAAMGALAWERVRAGDFDGLELDINPGLVR